MRNTLPLLCVAAGFSVSAQRVLHFTATSGYDHGTRELSFILFTEIGNELGVEVVNAPTSASFPDASALADFDAIIFSNTSGNNILDATQRNNVENWVSAGGHVLGIHAASDTYRHSTANGNNTGTWDHYAELIGASVQENPNHVDGTPPYEMTQIGQHASTASLPDPWLKNEEYYYWEGGYYGPDNTVVLEVEETVGPNGQVNSYDAPRPMSWYRELPSGTRVFYTALGHAPSNYTDDPLFRQHVKDALAWLLDIGTALPTHEIAERVRMHPNPASAHLQLTLPDELVGTAITLYDAAGRTALTTRASGPSMTINTLALAPGVYTVQVGAQERRSVVVVP